LSAIDTAMNELNAVFSAASQEMYNASQAQAGAQGQQGGQQSEGEQGGSQQSSSSEGGKDDGEVTDVDFEEVK